MNFENCISIEHNQARCSTKIYNLVNSPVNTQFWFVIL